MIARKMCAFCKKMRGIKEFHKNKSTADGLQAICKLCTQFKTTVKKYSFKMEYEKFMSTVRCKECGVIDHRIMDWHHENPEEKTANVSELLASYTWGERLYAEMRKCIPLCSNCHRIFHYEDRRMREELESLGPEVVEMFRKRREEDRQNCELTDWNNRTLVFDYKPNESEGTNENNQ